MKRARGLRIYLSGRFVEMINEFLKEIMWPDLDYYDDAEIIRWIVQDALMFALKVKRDEFRRYHVLGVNK